MLLLSREFLLITNYVYFWIVLVKSNHFRSLVMIGPVCMQVDRLVKSCLEMEASLSVMFK